MDRNLDRRVEAFVPIDDTEARAEIDEILRIMLSDDRRSWQLRPDATWVRTEDSRVDQARSIPSPSSRIGRSSTPHLSPTMPPPPGAGAGSLDPRA